MDLHELDLQTPSTTESPEKIQEESLERLYLIIRQNQRRSSPAPAADSPAPKSSTTRRERVAAGA